MAVLCFAASSSGGSSTAAAQLVGRWLVRSGLSAALHCNNAAPSFDARELLPAKPATHARQFINDLAEMRSSNEYLLVDFAELSDINRAIALSVADLVLLPIQTESCDAMPISQILQLLGIIYSNRPGLPRCLFFIYDNQGRLPRSASIQLRGLLRQGGHRSVRVTLSDRICQEYGMRVANLDASASRTERHVNLFCRTLIRELGGLSPAQSHTTQKTSLYASMKTSSAQG